MINYVNNAFDKVLKPCDAQRFSIIVNSQETEKHILGHRGGDAKAKSKLPAITYMGVLDSDKYRKYLDGCKQQGIKPQGSRRAEFMRPTGLLMLDFDHVGAQAQTQAPLSSPQGGKTPTDAIDSPVKLWEFIKSRYDAIAKDMSSPLGGSEGGSPFALAHITPSGDGLRVVLQREKGKSIEQEQYEWCKAMGVKCDDVCKDISRLSFAPMQSEILYFNPSLLFGELPNAEDYPDGSLWGGAELRASLGTPPPLQGTPSINRGGVGEASTHPEGMQPTNCPSVYRGTSTECGGSSKQSAEQYPTDYNGIEYNVIVQRLEEQLGGAPAHGARNSFIFTMACNLRYICNDDVAWVASILPTYGEEPQKHRMTIQSAINRPMSKAMPETMARALNVAKMCSEGDNSQFTIHNSQLAPEMPTVLPEPIRLLTSRTPERMKPAVAMAVFPPLGAHIKDTRFTYWDGRDYEPTFMNVLVAELSAGKSAVNAPIKYIIADIEASDEGARNLERGWREKCSNIKNPDDRPERPKGLVRQVLSADMTNAAFVQRLADADGHFLYTQMDEIELLNALKTNTQRGAVSAVLRLAFDCGIYGQERVASNAIDAKAPVRWNWNASTTVQRVRKFFAGGIADGTLSRLSFATIIKDEDDWGDKSKPHYGRYSEKFARELLPYLDRIKTCRGTLHCPEAAAWADRLGDELVAFARDAEDRAYAQFSFRAVLMGFFRSMLLYVMNGMQWSREIEDFATWSVKYDLWCKMRFFRDMMHKDLEGERTAVQRGPVGLLPLLPQEFTREQVRDLRIAQGLKPDPKHSLSNWVKRGLIVRDDSRGLYIRL